MNDSAIRPPGRDNLGARLSSALLESRRLHAEHRELRDHLFRAIDAHTALVHAYSDAPVSRSSMCSSLGPAR